MSTLSVLGVILILAFLIETLIEFLFETIAGYFPNWAMPAQMRKSVIQTAAIVAGVGGAFLFHFDVLFLAGQFAELKDIPLTPYGMGLTGIAIGKGSNYIHQFIAQFFPAGGQK